MKRQTLNQLRFIFNLFLTVLSFTSLSQAVIAQSQINNRENSDKIKILFNQKKKTGSEEGRPTRRRGAGTRDNCPAAEIPLTALIPENKVSKVVEANPKFWFFIPYQSGKIPQGEFVLQDEDHNDVYRTNISVDKGKGIVSISLDSGKSLEKNKIYQWYFKLYCKDSGDSGSSYNKKSSTPIYVRGWIQRVALKTNNQSVLNPAICGRQCVALYAENGIWYSALNELAKLRQANPKNRILAEDWSQLLNDIGLQELSNQPIVGNLDSVDS